MTRSPNPKERIPRVAIPPSILIHHRDVILHIDYFFVNKIPFLHTKSEGINLLTVQGGATRTKGAIIEGIKQVIGTYHSRGFRVRTIHGDGEFDMDDLREAISPIDLEITGRDEHDGPIERSVRTVKERSRCVCHSIPYRWYTKLMITSMVENVIHWLNAFPFRSGISQTMGPSTIVLGRPAPDVSRKGAIFGSYVLGFKRTKNDMTERCEEAISLGVLNESGSHNFMSLRTGRRIKCHRWEELPITDEVIKRVEDMAQEEGQMKLIDRCPLFEWEDGMEVEDDAEMLSNNEVHIDEYMEQDLEQEASDDDDDVENESFEIEEHIENEMNRNLENEGTTAYDEEEQFGDEQENNVSNYELSEDEDDKDISYSETEYEDDDDSGDIEKTSVEDSTESEEEHQINLIMENENDLGKDEILQSSQPVRRSRRENAGMGVARSHPFIQFFMKDEKENVRPIDSRRVYNNMLRAMFTQVSAKEGIRRWGDKAIAAIIKELRQLQEGAMPGKPVIEAVDG